MPSLSRESSDYSSNRPKALAECSAFAALLKRTQQLQTLDQVLRQPLPVSLREQCCLADIKGKRIVFLASSSMWAAKLRLYQTSILASAHGILGHRFEKFAVKVSALPRVSPHQVKSKALSETTAQHLVAAAKYITDPELQTLYLKLASLAENSSS